MVALEQRQPTPRVRNLYPGGLNHNERRCSAGITRAHFTGYAGPVLSSTPLSGRGKSNWLAITARLIASHDLLLSFCPSNVPAPNVCPLLPFASIPPQCLSTRS
jgi:hypothetical protein